MKTIKNAATLAGLLALGMAGLPVQATFEDPLMVPARVNAAATRTPLVGVATAGDRIIAVGQRGVIVVSEDGGETWEQAQVPVRTDLLAVHFPTPVQGWAVGHGGVVIHTADGGRTWTKQLDGREASRLIVEHFGKDGIANGAQYVQREQSLAALGGTQPFMAVHFEDAQRGYVVGTFNRILRTEDAGKTWTPVGDRVDNPDELHFNAISAGLIGLFLVGERGMVWAFDKESGRFVKRPTGYDGTLFGIVVGEHALVAYGMRGSVYRSADGGASWQRVDSGGHAGVSGGVSLPDGRVVLTTLAGGLLIGDKMAERFETRRAPTGAMSYFGVAPLASQGLALVGAEGVRVQSDTERLVSTLKATLASSDVSTR